MAWGNCSSGNSSEALVIVGATTSGFFFFTLRQAADLDYRLTVLHELCQDPESEVHLCLVEKVFHRHADVVVLNQWAVGLGNLIHLY